jgi:hypothetical protein
METALNVFGAMIVLDLLAAFGLMGLVWLVHRRSPRKSSDRLPTREMFGALIFLGVASALIYGAIWAILRAGPWGR